MRKVTVYCDTDESKDMSDQNKALFEELLNTLIEADNAAEDDFGQMPTFTWTGGEYIPDFDK